MLFVGRVRDWNAILAKLGRNFSGGRMASCGRQSNCCVHRGVSGLAKGWLAKPGAGGSTRLLQPEHGHCPCFGLALNSSSRLGTDPVLLHGIGAAQLVGLELLIQYNP